MGRKPLPDDLRKEVITIRLPNYLIQKLKKKNNYNQIIEKLLEIYFSSDENKSNL